MQAAAYGGVLDGSPLSIEPRGEEHTARTRGSGRCQRVEGPIRVGTRLHEAVGWHEAVIGKEDTLTQERQASASGLLDVDYEIAARDRRGERGKVVNHVGLLERDVACQPRRGTDVQVALKVARRARADSGRGDIRGSDHYRYGRWDAQVSSCRWREWTKNVGGRQKVREL